MRKITVQFISKNIGIHDYSTEEDPVPTEERAIERVRKYIESGDESVLDLMDFCDEFKILDIEFE